MKQTKWQRLATIGLCSSLVINAFSGVTAVAETITIESSPTVASSVKEETTKASTETSEATTETSRKVMKEQETEESVKQEVVKEKEEPKEKVEQDIVAPSINKISPRATVIFPESIFQIGFVDEKGALVAPENVSIKYDYINWEQNVYSNRFTSSIITPNVEVPNVNGLKQIVLPAANIAQTNYPGPNGAGTQNAYRGTAPANFSISIPKYYENLSLYDQSGNISPAYPLPIVKQRNKSGTFALDLNTMKFYLNVKKKDDGTYTNTIENNFKTTTLRWPIIMERRVDSVAMGTHYSYYSEGPVYYHLTNRKVTESFKDTAGATIPAPTGFTQGKQTSITSNNYTFKQAGTLPETYKASNGKTYKFKGWYKGKTKPNTLTTTKAPSYAVTYDDNDDLNVVYEEMVPQDTWIYPGFYAEFVDENGQAFNEPLTFSGSYTQFLRKVDNTIDPTGTRTPIVGTKDTSKNNRYKIGTQSRVTMPANFDTQVSDIYNLRGYTIDNISITNTLNYVDKIEATTTEIPVARYPVGYVGVNPVFNNGDPTFLNAVDKGFKKGTDNKFAMKTTFGAGSSNTTYPRLLRVAVSDNPPEKQMVLIGFDGTQDFKQTMNYKVTRKQVTEKFIDTNGVAITPPTGFTQNKKTPMTSNAFTFKQSGTLPETYKASNGKTYKFKGWYKGKTKPNTLTTTKAPSYAVTYDDNDDLNVVYEEETVTTLYPSINMNFVNEKGGTFTPALTFSGKYYAQSTSASLRTDLYDVTSKNNGSGQYTVSINNGSMPLSQELLKKYNNGQPISATNRLRFNVDKLTINQQLKYVDTIQVDTAQSSSLNYYGHKYTSGSSTIFDPNIAPTEYNMTTEQINSLNFSSDGTYFSNANNRFFNMHLGYSSSGGSLLLMMALFNENPVNQPKLVYKVTRKQVTENFVDANGAKITAPTGFTQGNKIPMTSNTFKYTAAKALPATYTAGGKTYTFQGWYKGKTKPNTLTTSTTPTYNTTFDGNDDMTAMYKEEVPKASVALTRTTAETVTSGGNVTWRATITNTSQAPLTTATIKKSTAWTTGLAAPTAMIVTPAGGTAKTVPVTATTWTNGVSLGTDIPVGKSATVQFTTKATGTAGQVLRAGITTSGNYSGVSASATVRVKDNDQAIVTPTAEGFISVPTFNFGQVGVAGSTQQHSLKKAADYYGNGTRNPYLRIKKTQPNWSLTAQLSQPKSATDSLPTATRLLLGAAPVSSFSNYNQPTELKNAVGTTSAISLNANNTATRIIANQQFTGSNIYQLDFTFNNVKLEVPANQGVKGQQYQAAVTWNLVTGP
ncbi:WxL domain-containing protein [Enterococcus faecalis]|uniref:WxL domain-containing protein n=2 Tax=Bacteria TaxID=2 RepID=UPI0032533668